MTKALIAQGQAPGSDPLRELIYRVLDSLGSDSSRRAYHFALNDFFDWHRSIGRPALTKAVVEQYRADLALRQPQDSKDPAAHLSAATINFRLAAVRKLARLAGDEGLMNELAAERIAGAEGVKAAGTRSGNWLTQQQAQALLALPDVTTLKGLRDRAVLAVLMGTGLRRAEAAALTFARMQQREGRWVLLDLSGKGGRTRTIPLPGWAHAAIMGWKRTAGLADDGAVFRAVARSDRLGAGQISPQAIRDIVHDYGQALGVPLAPHDLRRTFSKLARAGGGQLEQIQLSLGHANIQTTQRYLGTDQDLQDAPGDHLGLHL